MIDVIVVTAVVVVVVVVDYDDNKNIIYIESYVYDNCIVCLMANSELADLHIEINRFISTFLLGSKWLFHFVYLVVYVHK